MYFEIPYSVMAEFLFPRSQNKLEYAVFTIVTELTMLWFAVTKRGCPLGFLKLFSVCIFVCIFVCLSVPT